MSSYISYEERIREFEAQLVEKVDQLCDERKAIDRKLAATNEQLRFLAEVCAMRGSILMKESRYVDAASFYAQAAHCFELCHDEFQLGFLLLDKGDAEHKAGDTDSAKTTLTRAIKVFEKVAGLDDALTEEARNDLALLDSADSA